MYSIGTAALILGVCVKTVRRWHKVNKIHCIRTPGGHRRYSLRKVKRIIIGLFRSLESITINADKNGVYNIMKNTFPHSVLVEGIETFRLIPQIMYQNI